MQKFFSFVLIILTIPSYSQIITLSDSGVDNLPGVGNSFTSLVDYNNSGWLDIFISGKDGPNVFTRLYRNNGDGTFTHVPAGFTPMYHVRADWADFNNNGYLDLLISGLTEDLEKKCIIYKNNGDGTFTDIDSGLEQLALGDVAWGDLSNNGLQDVFMSGINESNSKVSRIYRNNNGTFELMPTVIQGVSNGSVLCFDSDKNGYIDILITGLNNSGVKINYLYRNNGNFSFSGNDTGMERITSGRMAVGDFDNDGFQDVIVTGSNHSSTRITKLYRYQNGMYVEAAASTCKGLSGSSAAFADFNNNGLLDIIITGIDIGGLYHSLIYSNNGDGSFSEEPLILPGVMDGHAVTGDLYNNGKIDLVISGLSDVNNICKVFQNQAENSNELPSIPDNHYVQSGNDTANFFWDIAVDSETPSSGITYSIYVGTGSGEQDIISPSSEITSGKRKVYKPGELLSMTSFTLRDMDEGEYFWSVQSVDNAYQGSQFASEQSFIVCHDIFIGNDTSLCYGDTLHLSVGTSEDVVNWYSFKQGLLETNSNNLSFHVMEKDTIVAELTKLLGCTLYDTIVVDMLPLPVFSLGNDTSVCFKDTITLNVGDGWQEIIWYEVDAGVLQSSGESLVRPVFKNETIFVRVTDFSTCVNYDTIKINRLNLPQFSLGNDTAICHYDTLFLIIPLGYSSVEWHTIADGMVQSSGDIYPHAALKNDMVFAIVTDENSCSNNDSIVVNMYNLPQPWLGIDTSVCYNQPLVLNAGSGWSAVEWFTADAGNVLSGVDEFDLAIFNDEMIWVGVTDNNGCSNSDTIEVTMLGLPEFNIGKDTSLCYFENILLSVGAGWNDVRWFGSLDQEELSTNWFFEYQSLITDTIVAIVTNHNNCVGSDTIVISTLPLPVFDLGNDTALCKYEYLDLTTGLGWYSVYWHSDVYGSLGEMDTLYIAALETSEYQVVVTDNYGCMNADTLMLTVYPLPETALPADTFICHYDTIMLDAGGHWQQVDWYFENDGLIAQDTVVVAKLMDSPGRFFAEVTNHYGCQKTDTCFVEILPLPAFSLGNDTALCMKEGIEISVNIEWNSILWHSQLDGVLASDIGFLDYFPEKTDKIYAEVTDSLGCINIDSISVVLNQLPEIDAGNDTIICYNTQVILGAGPVVVSGNGSSFTYNWFPSGNFSGSNLENPLVSPNNTEIFYLEVVDENNCIGIDSVLIEVNPPTIVFLQDSIAICYGEEIRLGENPVAAGSNFQYTYSWYPELGLNNATIPNPMASPLVTTRYLLVVNTGLCDADSAYIHVTVNPLPIIYVSPELTIGSKGQVQLYAEGGGYYNWSPRTGLNLHDIPDPVASPEFSTLYTVEVTDSLGCSNENQVMVNVANKVFVPNLFTPNGDGINDYFRVYGYGFRELKISIYDSQNRKVFESMDAIEITETGWDGNINGVLAKNGIYRWRIQGRFLNGEPVLFEGKDTGIVTLMR